MFTFSVFRNIVQYRDWVVRLPALSFMFEKSSATVPKRESCVFISWLHSRANYIDATNLTFVMNCRLRRDKFDIWLHNWSAAVNEVKIEQLIVCWKEGRQ